MYEAWNAGDMHAVGEVYDPDAVIRGLEGWPEPGPFLGRDAIMREWEHVREAWSADVVEPVGDFIDAGDRVVVRHRWLGAGEGPAMDVEITNVSTLRNGRIVLQEFFWDHAAGLEAVGLSE